MKFSTKLTALFSSVIIIAGVVLSYFVYVSNAKILEENIGDRLKNQAFHTMDKIDRMLFEKQRDIRFLASDPIISSRHSTQKQITERLTQLKDADRAYVSVSFFGLNRVRIADTAGKDIGRQHSLSEYWPEISGGKDFTYNISASESVDSPVFHFASIVKDKNGSPFGVVVARMPVESLYEIVRQGVGIYNIEKDFLIELVDKEGLILYSNRDSGLILKKQSSHWVFVRESLKKGMHTGIIKHIDSRGENLLVFTFERGYEDFKGSGWMLITEVPTKIALISAVEIRNNILVILFIIGFFAYVAIRFLSSRLSLTIERLSAGMDEVAKGNLDFKVAGVSQDEIGKLTESFNSMVALRKTADETVRESENRFRKLFENSNDAIFIHTLTGEILDANIQAENMTGYPLSVLKTMSVPALHPPEELETSKKAFEKTVSKGSTRIESHFRHSGGAIIDVELSASIVDHEKGIIQGIARDITERKTAEDELKRIYGELQEKTEYLERFNRLMVGRELEMIKLKAEVNELLEKSGQPKKYEALDGA